MPEQETREQEEQKPQKGRSGCSPLLIVGALLILVLLVIGFLSGPLGKSIIGDIGLPAWLSVAQPHPELPAEVIFHLFGFPITNSVIATWFTIIVMVVFSFIVTRRPRLVPKRLQTLLEFVIGALLSFCQSVAGEENGRRFFPIVATIFLFVIFNAWLSLLPGFGSIIIHTHEGEAELLRGANTDVNTPLAIALMSFVFVTYFGLKDLGISFIGKFIILGQFIGGLKKLFKGDLKGGLNGLFMGIIDMFIGIIELLSYFIRIISFTFRLFGNMTAGEILLLMATFLIPFVFSTVFYGLELLVGFVQALIFGGLTLIFMTVAVSSHGGEAH